MRHHYEFYMQKINSDRTPILGTVKNLEKDFEGLLYCKIVGLNDIGKPRIYTETYAEKSGIRVYVPDEITNDSTKVSLDLYFSGENRQKTLMEFNEYIRQGRHRYWDTARNLQFDFIVNSNIKVQKEDWYGMSYIHVVYQLQNLDGKTEIHQ